MEQNKHTKLSVVSSYEFMSTKPFLDGYKFKDVTLEVV